MTANTSTGWEFEVPLAAVGGAPAGSLVQMMAAYVNDDTSFTSDVLPQIAGQTAALGVDPNFTTIAGNQFFTYQVGQGVLASRAANAALPASAYPNPVAADSRVVYTVTVPNQAVSVEAYNTLGQRVATLLEATTQSAGQYSVGLSPLQGLAAGVYLVRVRAGKALTTQRVVVR